MDNAPLEALAIRLNGGESPRVWSFLVTVFGEFAQEAGAAISASALRQMMAVVGIKPEATRVALHRLRKDGWIESTKTGRTSVYRLTPKGRAETIKASPRIYATQGPTTAWLVLVDLEYHLPQDLPLTRVAPHCYLSPDHVADEHCLCQPLDLKQAVPSWMSNKLCPPEQIGWSQSVARILRDMRAVTPNLTDPISIATLRVMIVHSWRRVILKVPEVPEHLFPSDWAGDECRALVANLLSSLPKPALDTLGRV